MALFIFACINTRAASSIVKCSAEHLNCESLFQIEPRKEEKADENVLSKKSHEIK